MKDLSTQIDIIHFNDNLQNCIKIGEWNVDQDMRLTSEEELFAIEQIKYLHTELVSIQQSFLNIISVSVGVYALVFYYAFTATGFEKEIFLLLPFLFLWSLYNILKYTIKSLGIGAYIRHLEKLVNRKHNKKLFMWESYLINANQYPLVGVLPQVPCILAIIFVVVYKYIVTIIELKVSLIVIMILSILLCFQIILMIWMLYRAAIHVKKITNICDNSILE